MDSAPSSHPTHLYRRAEYDAVLVGRVESVGEGDDVRETSHRDGTQDIDAVSNSVETFIVSLSSIDGLTNA